MQPWPRARAFAVISDWPVLVKYCFILAIYYACAIDATETTQRAGPSAATLPATSRSFPKSLSSSSNVSVHATHAGPSASGRTIGDIHRNTLEGSSAESSSEDFWLGTSTKLFPLDHHAITALPGANGSKSAVSHAMQCWSEIATWRNESAAFNNARIAGQTWPMTTFFSSESKIWTTIETIYPSSVSTYRLCDGSPRVNIRPETTNLSGTTTMSGTYIRTLSPSFQPQPCSLAPVDCRLLYDETDAMEKDENMLLDECGMPAHRDGKAQCLVGGGPVELIYFPVKDKNASLCSNGSSAISAAPLLPGLSEITTLGRTFTSNSVYLSFKTLYATYDGFWDTVGPTFSDYIIPFHSSDISTHCGGWFSAYGTGTPLNYADLNWPVAASAYSCQSRCSSTSTTTLATLLTPEGGIMWELNDVPMDPQCKTIWSDVNPVLAIPTRIKEIVPQWSSCSFWNENIANFWFDPPIALQPREVAAEPSAPSSPRSTPAAPCSTPSSPAAPSTRVPSSSTVARDHPETTRASSIDSAHSLQQSSLHDPEPTTHAVDGPVESVPDHTVLSSTVAEAIATENPSILDGSGSSSQVWNDPAIASEPALSILTEALSYPAIDPMLQHPPTTTEGRSASEDDVFTYGPQPNPSKPTTGNTDSLGTYGSNDGHTEYAPGFNPTATILHTATDGEPTANPDPAMTHSNIVITASSSDPIADGRPVAAGSFTLHTVMDPQHSGVLILGGQILSNGGPPATVSGHTITDDQSGLLLLSASSTVAFTAVEVPTTDIAAAPSSLTIPVSSVADRPGAVAIGKITLSVGGPPMTTEGQVVTYASDGLVVHGAKTTRTFKPVFASAESSPTERDGIYALGSLTVTASSNLGVSGALLVNGETISRGGDALTMHDATITAGPSGLAVVKLSTTRPMSTLAETDELPAVVSKSTRTTMAETTSAPWSTLLAPSFKPEAAVTTTSDAAGRTFGQCWSAWPIYILLMFVLVGNM